MRTENFKMLKLDSKGRVCLGKLIEKGVSSYKAYVDEDTHKVILEPYVEIPIKEAWLFNNKGALNQVRKGIEESAEGEVQDIGSFSKYISENE